MLGTAFTTSRRSPQAFVRACIRLNGKVDLGGCYALLSEEFYYFGKAAPLLPEELRGIVKKGQGHRRAANDQYVDPFITWVRTLPAGVNGEPQMWQGDMLETCGSCRAESDEEDERLDGDDCGR